MTDEILKKIDVEILEHKRQCGFMRIQPSKFLTYLEALRVAVNRFDDLLGLATIESMSQVATVEQAIEEIATILGVKGNDNE